MEFFNISVINLAAMLASFSPDVNQGSSEVSTYVLPAIAGQWEIQLDKPQPQFTTGSDADSVAEAMQPTIIKDENTSNAKGVDDVEISNRNNQVIEPAYLDNTTSENLTVTEKRRVISQPEKIVTDNIKQNVKTKTDTSTATQVTQGCRELYNFGRDNVVRVSSGDEWTLGHYIVTGSNSDSDKGLPIMAMKTVYDNNQPDCSGNQVDQTGESTVVYLDYNDRRMSWCSDAEGKHCRVHFNRVYP